MLLHRGPRRVHAVGEVELLTVASFTPVAGQVDRADVAASGIVRRILPFVATVEAGIVRRAVGPRGPGFVGVVGTLK